MSCLHCAENVGRLVVAWGAEVVIFEPSMLEDKEQTFGLERAVSHFCLSVCPCKYELCFQNLDICMFVHI